MLLTLPSDTPVTNSSQQQSVAETRNISTVQPARSSLSLLKNKSEKKGSFLSSLSSAFLRMLLRRKWLIVLTTLLISLIGVVSYLLMRPINITIGTVLLAGILSGLFLGTMIASIREWRNSLLLSKQDLQDITGYQVLGVIPESKRGEQYLAKEIADKPYSRIAEAYRLAATLLIHGEWKLAHSSSIVHTSRTSVDSILDSVVNNAINSTVDNRILLITSVNAGEGKSVSASNLAFCLAEMGAKVLIVDCDFRKPSIHFKLGIQNKEGLINYLQNKQDLSAITHHVDSMPGLFAITAGAALQFSPVNLLSKKRMTLFINNAQKYFDYVILDAPPIKGFADTLLLHAMTHSTIVVVPEKKEKMGQIKASLNTLEQVKPSILGLLKVRAKKDTVEKDYYKNYSQDSISERLLFNKTLNLGKNRY